MFIETYYDERVPVPGSTSEPLIPYPELSGEELAVWQEYLPIRRPLERLHLWFEIEAIPRPVMTEIEKAKRIPRSFDHIEIWSRADDPMAVGVIGEEKPRYFSIVRWGDAKLTLAQVKRKLRVEKWLLLLSETGGIVVFLVTIFAIVAYGWITIGLGFAFN
jgi:hypothetical protein